MVLMKSLNLVDAALSAGAKLLPVAGTLPQRVGLDDCVFYASLKTSLIPERGGIPPTFTRASTAYVPDHEGILRSVLSGEARFKGARRVRNMVQASNIGNNTWGKTNNVVAPTAPDDISAVTVTSSGTGSIQQSVSVVGGRTYAFSFYVRRGTANLLRGGLYDYTNNAWLSSVDYTALTNTNSWTRIAFVVTVPATCVTLGLEVLNGVITGTSFFRGVQCEDVTGQSNQAPGEFVSVGELCSPWHGAGVDGVQYFDTLNGNSIAGNIVTEAPGAAISDATLDGYFCEGQRTNSVTWNGALTTAPWGTGAGVTVSPNAGVAPDGANTAWSFTVANGTPTGAGPQISQGGKNFQTAVASLYIKANGRSTFTLQDGSGNGASVDLSTQSILKLGAVLSSGGAWLVSLPNGWYRLSIFFPATAANPGYFYFYDSTPGNGDGVSGFLLWMPQLEATFGNASFGAGSDGASSPIPTSDAAVVRKPDALTFDRLPAIGEGAFSASVTSKRRSNSGSNNPAKSALIIGNYGTNASITMDGYNTLACNTLANFFSAWDISISLGTINYDVRHSATLSLAADLVTVKGYFNGVKTVTATATHAKSATWGGAIDGTTVPANLAIGGISQTNIDVDQNIFIRDVALWKRELLETEVGAFSPMVTTGRARWTFTPTIACQLRGIAVPGCESRGLTTNLDARGVRTYYSLDGGANRTEFTPGQLDLNVAIAASQTLTIDADFPFLGNNTTQPQGWVGGDAGEGPTILYDDLGAGAASITGALSAPAAISGALSQPATIVGTVG